jgi:riboflavin kinase / FMN adenylyltransferase
MLILESFSAAQVFDASVCCVGTFDGIHLGHQQLIRAAVGDARSRSAKAVLITFFPHPRVLLSGAPGRYLTTQDEKAELIAALGIDIMLVHPFDQVTLSTSADAFVELMLNAFAMRGLWLGPDFALGHRRQGDSAFLAERGRERGFDVHVMPQLSLGDRPISSSRIREAIARGDLREAAQCLGRPYHLSGVAQNSAEICLDAQCWPPPPGRYLARVDGQIMTVGIATDCRLSLERPVARPGARARVEFV